MNKRNSLKQFVKYGLVGVVNTLLTFVSYWIIKAILGNVDVANALSYALGMLCSFFLNKRWTFQSRGKRWKIEATLFFGGCALCWGVQWMAFRLFLTTLPEVVAQLAGMVVYTLLGFVFNKTVTFRK